MQIIWGETFPFPDFGNRNLRRNSFMLMPLTRKTLLPISKGALLTESSSSRLSSSSKSGRKNKNVLMMIYLPAYYNCSRSRLFSSLFFVFVQEFIDPVSKRFCFLHRRRNSEGSNDHTIPKFRVRLVSSQPSF